MAEYDDDTLSREDRELLEVLMQEFGDDNIEVVNMIMRACA